jgi:hypothetical protein
LIIVSKWGNTHSASSEPSSGINIFLYIRYLLYQRPELLLMQRV